MDGNTDSVDVSLSKPGRWWRTGMLVAVRGVSKESDATGRLSNTILIVHLDFKE